MARSLVRVPFLTSPVTEQVSISLVMASIVQRFDLRLDDPSYALKIKQTLTVKPADLRIRASVRNTAVHLYATPSATLMTNRDAAPAPKVDSPQVQSGLPFYVLYGSNTGTSEAFAQRLANEAPSYGTLHGFIGQAIA
jgi:cytochrome P450/NADPH-cytochrome P450 reductase